MVHDFVIVPFFATSASVAVLTKSFILYKKASKVQFLDITKKVVKTRWFYTVLDIDNFDLTRKYCVHFVLL